MLNPPDENTENRKLKTARRHENLKLLIISPRAARLLLSQHIWWEHGEHSLLVGIPTDTPEAPTMGPCRASAAKRRPLQRRETTRGARARRSRALAAKRAAIGSAAVGLTNSSHTRPYSRASARSLQERLTSCRRQPRPTVTSEAHVGLAPSQGGGPASDPRIIRRDCVLQKTGPTRNQPKSRGDPGSEEVHALSSRPRRTLQ